MLTFEWESEAYWTAREATTLSRKAMIALEAAEPVAGRRRRKVTCSREIAEELRAWCREAERAFVDMEGHEGKSEACRRAAEMIDSVLGQAAP